MLSFFYKKEYICALLTKTYKYEKVHFSDCLYFSFDFEY
jgi:hypothetical protein